MMTKSNKQRHAASIVLISVMWLMSGCQQPADDPAPILISGVTMGTTYSVQLFTEPDAIDMRSLESEIHTVLAEVNGRMSTYLEDSELSRFNRSKGSGWFPVSADTAVVLSEALRVSALTGGAFDVTIGPVVNLWGFGPGGDANGVPEHAAIVEALEGAGFEALFVRLSPPSVRKTRPELQVDLSAIAKGYAVDRVANVLEERHIGSYLVEIGGELRAGGGKPDGSAWRVAIEKPLPGGRSVQRIVRLTDAAIATSGGYRNYFEREGIRYSHTIDPRRGYPVSHRLASVSIIASSAMEADALATAILVMGPEDGFELAVREQIAAFFVEETSGGFEEVSTPPFESYQHER